MNIETSERRRRFSFGSFALGLLLGAAAGGTAALLLAPASGHELRSQLKAKVSNGQGQARKIADEGSTQIKGMSGSLGTTLGAKLALLRQAFEAGKQAARSKHQQLETQEAEHG